MRNGTPRPDELDGRMVEITGGQEEHRGFLGMARDSAEHGWIAVHLDAIDPDDTRVIHPLSPQDVRLRPDLE